MPSDAAHFTQVAHNIAFLEEFYSDFEFKDWSITVSFYVAVHVIEGVIFKLNQLKYGDGDKTVKVEHSNQLIPALDKNNLKKPLNYVALKNSDHASRKLIISENFSQIDNPYQILYHNSRNARYYAFDWSENDVKMIVPSSLKAIIEWSNKNYGTNFKINCFK